MLTYPDIFLWRVLFIAALALIALLAATVVRLIRSLRSPANATSAAYAACDPPTSRPATEGRQLTA